MTIEISLNRPVSGIALAEDGVTAVTVSYLDGSSGGGGCASHAVTEEGGILNRRIPVSQVKSITWNNTLEGVVSLNQGQSPQHWVGHIELHREAKIEPEPAFEPRPLADDNHIYPSGETPTDFMKELTKARGDATIVERIYLRDMRLRLAWAKEFGVKEVQFVVDATDPAVRGAVSGAEGSLKDMSGPEAMRQMLESGRPIEMQHARVGEYEQTDVRLGPATADPRSIRPSPYETAREVDAEIVYLSSESVPGGFAAKVLEVVRERGSAYGHPSENHQLTADMWSLWISRNLKLEGGQKVQFSAEDVCMFNVLQKASRLAFGTKDDSWQDIAGYTENVAMLFRNQRNGDL